MSVLESEVRAEIGDDLPGCGNKQRRVAVTLAAGSGNDGGAGDS